MKSKFAAILAFVMLLSCQSAPEPEQPAEPFIWASRSAISFYGDGGERTFNVDAQGAWKAVTSASWIKVAPGNAVGSKTITLVVKANPAEEERTGRVDFILTAYPDLMATVELTQKPRSDSPVTPEDPETPEEPGMVIPRDKFSQESDWGVTGSIMGLNWGLSGAKDKPMLEDVESGWMAAFGIEIKAGEEFKFRKGNDKDWTTNLGASQGQPRIDRKYALADNGGNLKPAPGTYDLYLHPTFSIMYVEEAGAEFAHGDSKADSSTDENVRIYVLNNSTWTMPYMYAYVGDGELQPYGGWPGMYASGTKQFGRYTYTYWEASGFNGVGNVNLMLNNNGVEKYPDPENQVKEPLWTGLTILNNLFFEWDGTKLTKVEDPENPGAGAGEGTVPAEIKFGTSSWTIVGTLADTEWTFDFAMDTEGYWEVARDVEVRASDTFKFRQNRSWGNNYGLGQSSATAGAKVALAPAGADISLPAGRYDMYLAAENMIAYFLPTGSAWTHEDEGKPEYSGSGDYNPELDPSRKLSGITYQVNVFSFKDSNGDGYGDLNGITASLDYFDKLGVTGLWLSPLQPAQSYHGYDVTDYEAINSRYGTDKDFQNLITEAHKHNIRIYMDYVINHAGDQSIWFNDVKEKGDKSPYWDYFSLSKNPKADIAAGKIAQVDPSAGYDSYKWFPVTIGGRGQRRFKIELDWTNASAPTMTVTETSEQPTTPSSGTFRNPERYLYWGSGTYSQFADNGQDKYVLVLDYKSDWGCLVRTTKEDKWDGKTKWGLEKTGDQVQLHQKKTLFSDADPNKVQSIVMPGGEVYYYYSEFGTGMFVDFNYGPADQCENSNAFKAIIKSAKKWLEMGVDGFRLDAVKHIYHDEEGPENKAFWSAFYNACNEIYKENADKRTGLSGIVDENIFMVGEVLSGDSACTPFYSGLPALFEFQFWWDLRECLNAETIYRAGYNQNFPGSLEYRWNNHRGVRQTAYGYPQDAISTPKLANHDEDRTASTLGNYKPKIRLAAAVLLTSPGRPYIYQGEELGYWGTKSGGDEYVRTPILWKTASSSAASKGVFNKVDWNMLKPEISVESQSKDDASLLNLYRHFAYARSVSTALADGWPEPDGITTSGYDGHIAGWYMHSNTDEKVALVMHNFSAYTITVDRSSHGNNLSNILVSSGKVEVSGYNVTMPAYSSVVFALN